MNIYDISQKAGVSIATVSRVINGSARVSDKTREKVLAAIRESEYTPNVFARGLGLNTMKTVGIMCADSSDPYLAQAVYYLEEELRKSDYDALLMCTGYDHKIKEKCMNSLLMRRVDGIILVGSNYVEADDSRNSYIRNTAEKVPVMMINGSLNAPNIYCTVCDDFSAMYDVTKRMLSSGRRSPLYIYNSESYSGQRKLGGYLAALSDIGIPFAEERTLFVRTLSDADAVRAVFDALCGYEGKKKSMPFDCVMTSDDVLAVGTVKYAKHRGLSVPGDIAVTGYNNFIVSVCCEPELTSVDSRLRPLCTQSVSSLMSIFSGETDSVPKQTVFPAEVVERATTDFGKIRKTDHTGGKNI